MRTILLLALSLAACTRGGDDTAEPIVLTAGETATATIDAAGGSIAVGDFRLEVPEGALDAATDITVTEMVGDDSRAWLFEPEGLQFEIPATAWLPTDALEADDGYQPLLTLSQTDGTWTGVLATDTEEGWAVPIAHFSLLHSGWGVTLQFPGVKAWASVPRQPLVEHDPSELHFNGQHTVLEPIWLAHLFSVTDTTGRWKQDAELRNGAVHTDGGVAFSQLILTERELRTEGQVGRWGGDDEVEGLDVGLEGPAGKAQVNANVRCLAPGNGQASFQVDAVAEGVKWETQPFPRAIETPGADFPSIVWDEEILAAYRVRYDVVCTGERPPAVDLLDPLGDGERWKAGLRHLLGTEHSTGDSSVEARPSERIESQATAVVQLAPAAAARLQEAHPIGESDYGVSIRQDGLDELPSGDYVVVSHYLGDALAVDGASDSLQFGVVFDADGDRSNNYAAGASYPGDFWQDTDLWYELSHTPSAGWQVEATDVREGYADVPTGAWFVLEGRTLTAYIPREELGAEPSVRSSAFWHDGRWGMDGAPWSGDFVPALDEPLTPIDVDDVIAVDN